MPKILNINKIKEIAIKTHGDKYDYCKSSYSAGTLYNIFCSKHGFFNQSSYYHLKGCGCPKCYNRNKTNDDIINEFKEIHKNKFDYSLVIYKGWGDKVKIICKKHGVFEQSPNNHLKGKGCPVCSNNKKHTNITFTNKAIKIHKNKYNYSKVEYISGKKKIKIICQKHGVFKQTPNSHLVGYGCSICAGKFMNTQYFIEKANKTHNNKFKYLNTIYINAKSPVKINCEKHGEFTQTPNAHLNGHGCPFCSESKGEYIIATLLKEKNVNFVRQKRFNECRNIIPLSFDFYLPDHKICVEFNGIQHYKPITIFDGDNGLAETKKRDKIKIKYCQDNNIELIIISYKNFNKIKEILNTNIFK